VKKKKKRMDEKVRNRGLSTGCASLGVASNVARKSFRQGEKANGAKVEGALGEKFPPSLACDCSGSAKEKKKNCQVRVRGNQGGVWGEKGVQCREGFARKRARKLTGLFAEIQRIRRMRERRIKTGGK